MLQTMNNSCQRKTVAHQNGKSFLYLLFDTFDPVKLRASTLKPEMVERAIFIQDLGERNRLFALLAVFKHHLAVLVPAGALHLDPEHPHRGNLDLFRDWLDMQGIDKRELRFVESATYDHIVSQGVVRSADFSSREDPEIRRQFNSWQAEGRLSCISE